MGDTIPLRVNGVPDIPFLYSSIRLYFICRIEGDGVPPIHYKKISFSESYDMYFLNTRTTHSTS